MRATGSVGRPRAPRTQIHPRLPAELGDRLRDVARGRGASQGSVIQEALARYLDTSKDDQVIIRRLDRLYRSVARLQRDMNVVAEALTVYVQVWLAHTPRLRAVSRRAIQATEAEIVANPRARSARLRVAERL